MAAIRVAATAILTTSTKSINGDVQVLNGEIKDYFINYYLSAPCEKSLKNSPVGGTLDSYTKTGVSNLLGVANGWPSNFPNGFIDTGSKNKDFVITRIATAIAP